MKIFYHFLHHRPLCFSCKVILPNELKIQLEQNPKAKEVFEHLFYTHQKEYVEWIYEAKKQDFGKLLKCYQKEKSRSDD